MSELPSGLSVSPNVSDVKPEVKVNLKKSDEKETVLSLFDEDNKMKEEDKSEQNLPVLADIQYEIKESKKSGLFNWRKKK